MADLFKVPLPSFTLVLTCQQPLPPRPSVIQFANIVRLHPVRTAPSNFMQTIDHRDKDSENRFAYMPQLPPLRRSDTFDNDDGHEADDEDDHSETAIENSRPTTARDHEDQGDDRFWKVDVNKVVHGCLVLLKRFGVNNIGSPNNHHHHHPFHTSRKV